MIFCQRCQTSNPIENENCIACGTRLLVISGTRIGSSLTSHDHTLEEHLLERISALEAALTRAQNRFEQLLELAQQQATGSFYDHMMIEALSEILAEKRQVDTDDLEQRWRTRVSRHYEETIERERLDERCARIIATYRGPFRDDFASMVETGTQLISEGHSRRGLKALEGAYELDGENAELSFTIGEAYFTLGKTSEAMSFLDRATGNDTAHFGARLLL